MTDEFPDADPSTVVRSARTGQASAGQADVDVQWQIECRSQCPADDEIRRWARMAIELESRHVQSAETSTADASFADSAGELTVRIVDTSEMRSANHQWRGMDKPTNVLSFPSEFPPETGLNYHGDILICAEVMASECLEQGKTITAHWAHIVIHGTLHLLGYDHIDHAEAAVMERREIEILATLGFNNPYLTVGESEISTIGGQ